MGVRVRMHRHWKRFRSVGMWPLKRRNSCLLSLANLVIQLMQEFFPEILDIEFTAHMEEELDFVEEGKEDWVRVLDTFYSSFEKRLRVR